MDRLTYIEKIEKEIIQIKKYLLRFLQKDFNYGLSLVKWFFEMSIKNFMIKYNSNKERVKRRRSRVYWIDFGINIGSEFNFPHFCVVIKEFDYTAIVIPISTVKEDDPEWKCEDNLIVEIGCLDDLPEEKKPSYAMVNQIKTVSKQRLSDYKYKGRYIKIKLNNTQMDLIDNAISCICKK